MPDAPAAGCTRLSEAVIFLDTSVLLDALTGPKASLSTLRSLLTAGERIALPSLVLYEWLRGPRTADELTDQEHLLPAPSAVPFTSEDAALGARLYRSARRARAREIDIAIAACVIRHEADLWTLHAADFEDIPELRLLRI